MNKQMNKPVMNIKTIKEKNKICYLMILNISQSKKMTKEKRYNKERGGKIRGMDIKGNERAGKK